MSTTIKIIAVRGTTTYDFSVDVDHSQYADAYMVAEGQAAQFEKWINEQPDRLALNDTQFRSTR